MADGARIPILKRGMTPRMRSAVAAFAVVAAGVLFGSYHFLHERFTEALRADAQLRAALYSGNLVTQVRRQGLVPPLLARDPVLASALQADDYTNTSARLIELLGELSVATISLLDGEGRVVASTDRRRIGANDTEQAYFINALREPNTVFAVSENGEGQLQFHYSRKIVDRTVPIGVVVIEVDLRLTQSSWVNHGETIAVVDPTDLVVLTSRNEWRNRTFGAALALEPAPGPLQRLVRGTEAEDGAIVYVDGEPMLSTEVRTGFRGWRLYYFVRAENVLAQVLGFLAFEALILVLLLTAALFFANKRLERQTRMIAEESDQLRLLNARLSAEIEERQKVERHLEVAEQSLEQTSKLAAIGQMSAAVSHELNQPLAAMRTYLAGARLLLQRKRPDEALSSFHRIDDLIERMGTITKQMKSYARKGSDALVVVDLRDAVDGSLAMMAPQLGQTKVEVRKTMPNVPVPVLADPVRLDQIIVNLLRNGIEASAEEAHPLIDILVVQGRQVSLSIRDNGHGIADPDALFEPFYTTKKPGEGVGLGLAISAGIAKELGGRLTARNAEPHGAIFELQLPRAERPAVEAAE